MDNIIQTFGGKLSMIKYRIIFDGKVENEIFDTYEAANEHALYLASCYRIGSEILERCNPLEYSYNQDNEPKYEIVEYVRTLWYGD